MSLTSARLFSYTAFSSKQLLYGRFVNQQIYSSVRQIHFSVPIRYGEPTGKPSSKVEESVKVLTDAIKDMQEGTAVKPPKRSLYKRIEDEVLHYYHGFRLLFIDIKISAKLIWVILNGKNLSRREHKQLIRTTSDVFRLVPFSVFIIVPFMELLLPVFLKLFPGMLPSTFQSVLDRETKMKAELQVKLEMAKFLQETLDEMAPIAKGRSSQTAKEFAEFMHKIRDSGSEVSNVDIMKFSKLFEDEITLDSLSRPQLLALCRVLEIPAYGPMTILRFQLRMRLNNLAADDRMIEKEGSDSLTYQELQAACKARGMRAVGVTEERLRRQVDQWLQLSLHEKVPPSLLLLSRAMYLPTTLTATAQLQATLSALPVGAALQTKAAIGEREGKVDNKTRIELLREEERLIFEEQQEAMKIKVQPVVEDSNSVIGVVNHILSRKAPIYTQIPEDKKDFESIEDAEEILGGDRKEVLLETEELEEELEDLKEEMAEYKEDVELLEDAVKQTGSKKVRVNKGARILYTKLNSMISEIDEAVDEVEVAEKAKVTKQTK